MSVEQKVRDLDKLRAQERELEGMMRDMRLGRNGELVTIQLRKGVFGFGWAEAQAVRRMSDGMEKEFYDFLDEKLRGVEKKILDAEAELSKIDERSQA